ncbi:LamG-like jellyroll fold domain-containing protein [Planctomycetota bacterium]
MTSSRERPSEEDKPLFDLVDQYFVGMLSDEAFQRLEKALLSNRALRDYYRQTASLDTGLGTLAASLSPDKQDPTLPDKGYVHRRHWVRAIAAIVVLTLICGALLVDRWNRSRLQNPSTQTDIPPKAAQSHLAVLTHVINATWTDSPALVMGASLGTDRLQASAGLFQIDFHSGVTMVAQAPLDLELLDPMQVRCRQGTLRLRVPYHARGFRVLTKQAKIVDKGTEFGMTVNENGYDLHVFAGEVEIHDANDTAIQLFAGQGWNTNQPAMNNQSIQLFPGPEEVASQQQHIMTERFKQWNLALREWQSDASLRLLYAFDQPWGWDRRLINQVPEMAAQTEGVLVGSRWTEGRWTGKRAIEFKQNTDSIRIRDDRKLKSLTLMTWICIDGFDREYNPLMTSDWWEPGCIHWQFLKSGCLEFGMKQSPEQYNSVTDPVLGQQHLGRWIQLALTYDHVSGQITHYLNGEMVPGRPMINKKPVDSFTRFQNADLRLGSAQLGNWQNSWDEIRNLNGRMDFFALWSRALSPTEIKEAGLAGQ